MISGLNLVLYVFATAQKAILGWNPVFDSNRVRIFCASYKFLDVAVGERENTKTL